jgi:hypothetical protein
MVRQNRNSFGDRHEKKKGIVEDALFYLRNK